MTNNDRYKLTKQEQASTTAYKMMSEKINSLEQSLKKTQDESEKERQEKHELDLKIVKLEAKLQKSSIIEIFKFLSSGGVGFAVNYITSGSVGLGIAVGIPSVVIYLVCIVIEKK